MSRGWAWINEDDETLTEERIDELTPTLDMLARQISDLRDAEERRGFIRQSDMEDGYGDYEFETDAEERAHTARETMRMKMHEAQLDVLHEELNRLGARMMRAYEHWNEDERYMEYMENRY